jgi:peroxiredoxin
MKKILILVLLLPFMAAAQKSFTLTGKLPELKVPAKVYLATVQSGAFRDVDSTDVVDGYFKFTGSVSEPRQAVLRVKRSNTPESNYRADQIGLFIENSKISITATDSIKKAVVAGSKTDNESRALEAEIRPLTDKIIRLNNLYGKKSKDGAYNYPIEVRQKAGDTVQALVAEIKNKRLQFVESHLTSFMGLYTYNLHILDNKFVSSEVEPLFNRFSEALKGSELGKQTIEKLEIGKRRQPGVKATDFTQNDLNDKPFTLSSLRGKYVLVDFWASWCVPCRAENPNVVKAYTQLKDKNFEIVGVSLDQGKAAWAEAVRKDGLPWIHVSDLKGWKNDVALMYGISSVPQNLLIDPKGQIIGKNLRGEALTQKLAELIK